MKINIKHQDIFVRIALATVTVILLNLIFYFGFFRIDLTANKIFSLSKASKKLVSNFDDTILIRAIFSKVLPDQFKFIRLYVEDLLKEYRTASRGKIKFEFIDPQQPRAKIKETEVQSMGIVPVEFTVLEKDKFEVKKGYMGIAMLYKDKKEVIPVVSNVETLEYDISSALKRLTLKEKKKIGILSSHKANTLMDEKFTQLRQQIYKLYDFEEVEISSESLKDKDGLLIIAPKENFDEKELFYLDQYILSGKPVSFLMSRYNINLQTFWATKINSNIFDLLSNYGIDFDEGMIVDYQCQRVSITSRQLFFVMTNIVEYPYMPIITKLHKSHPLVKNLRQVVLPFSISLKIKSGLEKVIPTILMETSKNSFIKKDVFSVNPLSTDFRMPKDAQRGPFIVAVELKGKFKSYYEDDNKFSNLKLPIENRLKQTQENVTSRVLIISSSDFMDQEPDFLVNITDYLAQQQDLLDIRSKNVAPPPLRNTSALFRVIVRYILIIIPSLSILGFGLFRWYLRKKVILEI
ncbi:MAG: GldG family protein [Endomicrobia bacterium]|nr:GldG family protein [Endomicrobiia bacterium]